MPADHMLDKGKQTTNFFDQVSDEYGRRRWRLKSLERYSAEFKTQEQPSKKYFSATTLPEIIKQYPIVRKGLKEAEVDKGEFDGFRGRGRARVELIRPSSTARATCRDEESDRLHRFRQGTTQP